MILAEIRSTARKTYPPVTLFTITSQMEWPGRNPVLRVEIPATKSP
jgi:hypothetical protein